MKTQQLILKKYYQQIKAKTGGYNTQGLLKAWHNKL